MRPHVRWMVVAVVALEVLLSISPKADRLTWALENVPVWIGLVALVFTDRKFPLSALCLGLFCLHAVILMTGGYYTYAKVPLGFWMQEACGLARNHYDRIGHFAQGFIPAIFVRELLLRLAKMPRTGWVPFLSVCVCLAFSACYEFFEWGTALATGSAAEDFLGTQGDPWDTPWDMFMAFVGAIAAMLCLPRWHDRSITRLPGKA